MRTIYSFLLLALATLGASFTASANVTCDLKWEFPGSVKIYVGGSSEAYRADVPADATSYHVDYENSFGTVYVKPTTGYFVDSAVCSDSNHAEPVTMTTNVWTGGVSINLNNDTNYHNGHEVWVNVSKLVYDKEITIDMLSSGNVTAKFEETGREVPLKYGQHAVGYASSHEKTISFYGTTSVYSESNSDGYEDGAYYLRHNGADCNWELLYNSWKHDELILTGDDTFEVKFNNRVPAADDSYTVTPVYADELAKAAINMVFNVTQKSSIAYSAPEAFDVKANDVIRFSFNTKDYVVTVDDEAIYSAGDYTTWEKAITENTTIRISATKREYGKVNVMIAVTDPEGIVVHDGSFEGPIIDISGLTPASDTFMGVTYQLFTVSVDEKEGKAFVEAADGWGITQSVIGTGGQDLQEIYAASTLSGILHVIVHKINRDSKLVVNVSLGQDAALTNLRLRNSQRDVYALEAGYNIIDFDPTWDSPFDVSPVDVIMEDNPDLGKYKEDFSVYLNYSAVAYNTDNVAYTGIMPADNSVLHIFVKRPHPAFRYITFSLAEDAQAPEVTYDVVKTAVPSAENNYRIKVFSGTEVTVKLASGTTIEGYEDDIVNGVLTLNPTAAITLNVIAKAQPDATMTIAPGDGDAVEDFTFFTIDFPHAANVAINENCEEDFIFASIDGESFAAWQYQVEELGKNAETEGATFKVIPNLIPTKNALYKFVVPQGYFIIDSQIPNEETAIIFEIQSHIKPEDITVDFSPIDRIVNYAEHMDPIEIIFNEGLDVMVYSADKIKLAYNDVELLSDDYATRCEGNIFMLQVCKAKYFNTSGTLKVELAAGALLISGCESPAITHAWKVDKDKEYTTVATYERTADAIVFTIAFAEADSAVVDADANMPVAQLEEENCNADRYIEQVAAAEAKQVASAEHPTFTLSFPAPATQNATYKFTLYADRFLLDGTKGNAELTISNISDLVASLDCNLSVTVQRATVIALDGRVLMINADSEQLKTLTPGTYIINGKKAIIK